MKICDERIIELPVHINNKYYNLSLTIDVAEEFSVICYGNIRYHSILFPEHIRVEINKQLESGIHHDTIKNLLSTSYEVSETSVINTKCSMLCRIELYVMDVYCECKAIAHNGIVDASTIEYSDFHVSCLVESFSHPVEWSLVGDYRSDSKEEWEEIKSCLIQRIHDGYYNYELAYKSLNLLGEKK